MTSHEWETKAEQAAREKAAAKHPDTQDKREMVDTDKPGAQRGPHGEGASATELMGQAQGRPATVQPDAPHHWVPKAVGAEAPPMRLLKAGTSETEWEFEGEDLEKKAWRYRKAAPLPTPKA